MKSISLIILFAFLIGCVFFAKTTKSVERPVTVEKPVTVERHITIEKPVYVERRVEVPVVVEKRVEVPVRVEVERRVEVPVERRVFVPVPVSPPQLFMPPPPPSRRARRFYRRLIPLPRIDPPRSRVIYGHRPGFVRVFDGGMKPPWNSNHVRIHR